MFRFIAHLLGRPYEPCRSCQILKEQLIFTNERNKELEQTLVNIVRPTPPVIASANVGSPALMPTVATFSRRRAILEQRDREAAQTLKNSPFVAKPDSPKDTSVQEKISELEKELNIEEPAQQES
jgi:hypothetical protein